MANVELVKVEQRRNASLLYSVRLHTSAGNMEFPIAIKDRGTAASNEAAVLRSTLGVAKELKASARLRLSVG